MYSLAKLLTNEPEKLESLIIAILKLLITLWISLIVFDVNLDLEKFRLKSSIESIELEKTIYFILALVGIWILLWNVIYISIIEFIVGLLSKIGGKSKVFFYSSLIAMQIIKIPWKGRIKPKKNMILFVESLENREIDEEFDIDDSRINQFFIVGLYCFSIFLYSSEVELEGWQSGLCIGLLIAMIFATIFAQKYFNYLFDNHLQLKRDLYPLSQFQKLINVVESCSITSENYDVLIQFNEILLTPKPSSTNLRRDKIILAPLYKYNTVLGELGVKQEIELYEKSDNTFNGQIVGFTNIESDIPYSIIDDKLSIIYAETEDEIFSYFEELFTLHQERFITKEEEITD